MLKKIPSILAVALTCALPAAAQTPPATPSPEARPAPRAARPQETPPRAERPAARADQPTPRAEPTPRPEPGQPVNVQLDLTITDQTGPGDPTRKLITMIVADRQNGFIRSRATVKAPVAALPPGTISVGSTEYRTLTINVDARPTLLREGTIRIDLGLEYQPTVPSGNTAAPAEPGMSNLNERISVIVQPGKPLTISQAADPASDRRISVELKATVLK